MANSIQKVIGNIALALLSFAVSVIAVEFAYRPFEPLEQKIFFMRHPFWQYDAQLGWTNIPNNNALFEIPEVAIHVRTNKDGMRYREVGPKKGFRVAVLGDSFTYGDGVEQEQRYTDLIEKSLGIEMLNFGVNVYAPLDYYLQLPKVISYHPDLVVIAFCPDNDFMDNVINVRYAHYKPYAVMRNGVLDVQGYPVPKRFGTDIRRRTIQFALGRLFYKWLWLNYPKLAENPESDIRATAGLLHWHEEDVYYKVSNPEVRKALDINYALLRAIKNKLDEYHIPLLIMMEPAKFDILHGGGLRLIKLQTRRLGIPFVYPPHPFGADNFYPVDFHWTPKGQAGIARILEPAIRKYLPHKE